MLGRADGERGSNFLVTAVSIFSTERWAILVMVWLVCCSKLRMVFIASKSLHSCSDLSSSSLFLCTKSWYVALSPVRAKNADRYSLRSALNFAFVASNSSAFDEDYSLNAGGAGAWRERSWARALSNSWQRALTFWARSNMTFIYHIMVFDKSKINVFNH